MTINPVDMQVILPQAGQVNKIQRGLQNQQQTEQKILGQMIQEEIRRQEQSVQKMKPTDKKKINDEEKGKKEKDSSREKKLPVQVQHEKKQDETGQESDGKANVGYIIDIKV